MKQEEGGGGGRVKPEEGRGLTSHLGQTYMQSRLLPWLPPAVNSTLTHDSSPSLSGLSLPWQHTLLNSSCRFSLNLSSSTVALTTSTSVTVSPGMVVDGYTLNRTPAMSTPGNAELERSRLLKMAMVKRTR